MSDPKDGSKPDDAGSKPDDKPVERLDVSGVGSGAESKTPSSPEAGVGEAAESTTSPPEAVKPTGDPVTLRLAEVGITDVVVVEKIKTMGAESVEDLNSLQEGDLVGVGVPVLRARKAIAEFERISNVPVSEISYLRQPGGLVHSDSVLPSVPDEISWLTALRAGGVLQVEQSTVMAAIRAALADRYGLFGVKKLLVGAMEAHIDVTEEQAPAEFFALRKELTRTAYGDLFEAIDGMDGSYVTPAKKQELLRRINADLWPAIITFNEQLAGWYESWCGQANPMMMMGMFAQASANASGGNTMVMPPGMMTAPDCGILRDAAFHVNDRLNRSFRGTGVQITAALAYEANGIIKTLSNNRLPMLCGVDTRDLLLKKLGIAIPATYERMEKSLTKFVLSIIDAHNVMPGNDELQYFGTLHMLGIQIPWSEIKRMERGEESGEESGGEESSLLRDEASFARGEKQRGRPRPRRQGIGSGE